MKDKIGLAIIMCLFIAGGLYFQISALEQERIDFFYLSLILDVYCIGVILKVFFFEKETKVKQ